MGRIQSFEAKIQKNRGLTEKLADDINRMAGSFGFFVFHALFFGGWMTYNSGIIAGVKAFDPFPFSFLTMLVSLEAIYLSIFVLMSQNRQSTISTLREEIHLQVNKVAEREVTKALHLLYEIHKKVVGDKKPDIELEHMLKTLNTEHLEQSLERQLEPQPMVIEELVENFEKKILGRKK